MGADELTFTVASRPHPGETANGDGWLVERRDGSWLIALVDGLGHGPAAAAAADVARATIQQARSVSVIELLDQCHGALRGLRGAAISIAQLDLAASMLTYAGVGNVEARLRIGDREERLIAYRGIVGAAMPRSKSFQFSLPPDWLLVLHTDGVSSRLDLSGLAGQRGHALEGQAQALLDRWGRTTDDATILIAAPALR